MSSDLPRGTKRLIYTFLAISVISGLSVWTAAQELSPDPATTSREAAPQISEYVRCIFEDQAGSLWFGTNSDGVCRYDGQSLVYLSTKDGLAGTAVRKILQTADGAMWFATEGGVSRYHHDVFTNFTVANGLSDNDTWSMMLDRAGTLWVGTIGGVCRYDGKSFVAFPIPRAEVEKPSFRFTPNLVWTMFEDREGNIWFGTDGEGARKYDGKSFTIYTTKDGLAGNLVRCILGDRQGRIWLGTETGGVSRYDGATFRNFTSKDGLGNERVYTMLEDQAGNLWFSTLADGVSRFDGKTFTVFRQIGDLTRTHVQSMLQDKNGTLWFGCSGGLFRFDGKSFVNVSRNGPWRMSAPDPVPKVADPMASFARMVGGEWRMTASSGTSMYDTWHWGPGKHSMRVMTEGASAAGEPWHELEVFYWHPGRKQVCLLGLSPFARGVSDGTIKFEGETAEGDIDLYQTGHRRKMGLRWAFEGPDKYHEILLESTGAAGYEPLVAWDHFRTKTPAVRPPVIAKAPKLAERLKVLELLLRHPWEAKGHWVTGGAFHIQSTFEWVPYADGIYARMLALTKDDGPMHVLDAYFYHHTGTGALRCLALSNGGGVYNGDLTVLEGGAPQLEVKGYEDDRVVSLIVRVDFEQNGTLRQRAWSIKGTERTPMLDVHHKKLESKKD